jgi:asparagine synthase (glutamine-hydrolysing)
MCGVVGFVSNKKNLDLINKFVEKVEHRGPDNLDSKIIELNNKFIHLGSSRLSIRGGLSENMPMMSKNHNYIVYNGEIFDLNLLKSKINSPATYKSDTRIILDLLDENVQNISDFNGMFAFAYLNQSSQKLYLSRDKLGIKPLFYLKNKSNEIFFSSEMSSLISIANEDISVTQENLNNLLLFNGITKSADFGKIKSVKPGELIEIDIKNDNKVSSNIFKIKNNYENESFEDLFKEVINDHLDADTPVDLFLSGGIDSSLIALIVKENLNRKVRHFSLTFEEKSYDESIIIEKISNSLNLESTIFKFDNKNINEYVSDAINNMNSIVLDYSFIPTFTLSKLTSEYSKAVLSGDGADELFGGYEWYRAIKYYNLLPKSVKNFLFQLINGMSLKNKNNGYLTFYQKVNLFFKYFSDDPYVQILIWQSPYSQFKDSDINELKKEISNYINKKETLSQNLRNIDLNNYLYTNILPKVDIASMANSLEVRPPFLDERIVQFAISNKDTNNVSFKNSKLYLRNQLEKTKLNYLNNYDKHGFGFPLVSWFENHGLEEVNQMYTDDNLVYLDRDQNYVKSLIHSKNLNFNNYRELWSYYVTSKWLNKNNIKII